MLTLQQAGPGDFFGSTSTPTNKDAIAVEARVLNTGPTYIDVAINGGAFEANFGPAPNNWGTSGKGDKNMRLRVDRYFSNVPYNRMVAAIGQLTAVESKEAGDGASSSKNRGAGVDESIRQTFLSTFAYGNPASPMYGDVEACKLNELVSILFMFHVESLEMSSNIIIIELRSRRQGR